MLSLAPMCHCTAEYLYQESQLERISNNQVITSVDTALHSSSGVVATSDGLIANHVRHLASAVYADSHLILILSFQ